MVKVTTALGTCSSNAHLRMQFCTHRKKCCWTYMHANKLAFICTSPVFTCQSPPSLVCISSVLVTHMTMCHRSWCYWSGSASPHWAQNMSYVACLMFGIASQHRLLALLAPATTKPDHALNRASSVTLNSHLSRVCWTTDAESPRMTCCQSASNRFPQTVWCPS